MKKALKILIDEKEIERRVTELGKEIERDYAGKTLVLICVLKGAMIFYADLVRKINLDMTLDTIAASSYGAGKKSSGKINLIKDADGDVAGKDVLIVEDIIDSGLTMKTVAALLTDRGAESVRVCAFLDKPSGRNTDFKADYVGYEIGDEFVVGYGLDFDGKYRNLPYVAAISFDEGVED